MNDGIDAGAWANAEFIPTKIAARNTSLNTAKRMVICRRCNRLPVPHPTWPSQVRSVRLTGSDRQTRHSAKTACSVLRPGADRKSTPAPRCHIPPSQPITQKGKLSSSTRVSLSNRTVLPNCFSRLAKRDCYPAEVNRGSKTGSVDTARRRRTNSAIPCFSGSPKSKRMCSRR